MNQNVFRWKVGFLGCPSDPGVPWNDENVRRLKELGFNALQLNIAWGARPADEPLNLEDVVDFSEAIRDRYHQPVPLRSIQTPEEFARRQKDLQDRIRVSKRNGMRTIFHFGAPYNAHYRYGDAPPNCLMDGKTPARNVALMQAFAEAYPGVDDLWLYTYDQDAWLCDEFGPCPRCAGIPLHERVTEFVNLLARTWRSRRPEGRLWWEPWELSAGQVLKSIALLDPSCVGLALHSNIAEVMATHPVDRWLKVSCRQAKKSRVPVIVEHFLGSPTEEVEPYQHISYPLVTLWALREIARLDVEGVKEYYGLVPNQEDPNLRMTGLFFHDPQIGDQEALEHLAQSYGQAGGAMIEFWKQTSEAMELFPWYTSWYIREIGKCNPCHSMSAAFIRGQQCHTPSWESTRAAIFMKTDNRQPDSWLLEDVQLQCEMAAERLGKAIELGKGICVPEESVEDFGRTLVDLDGWKRRALSYAYHLRETNLARMMRMKLEKGEVIPERMTNEMRSLLQTDLENQQGAEPCRAALKLLEKDVAEFLRTYFVVPDPATDSRRLGSFTLTSR